MGSYRWLFDGDSNMVNGTHGSPPAAGWIGDAILAVDAGTSLMTATQGWKSSDVLATIDATLAANTFLKYALNVGTNDIYYLTSLGGGTQSFEQMLATYTANITSIISKVKAAGITPYLLAVPPNWTGPISLNVFPNWSSFVKMLNAFLREFCVVNQCYFGDVQPWVSDVTKSDYQVDQFVYPLYADPIHYTQAGCTLVGTMAANSTIPTRTKMTGIADGYSWASCSLIGGASISGDADFGSLVCASVNDGANGYCIAYGKTLSDDLSVTITPYGDASKVDVYMRASARNIVRDYASIPWQKTNVLYTHGSPFVQWRIIAKEAATITHVGTTYQIL